MWHLLNPFAWIKAWFYARRSAKFDKSSFDLELYLYSKILKNNMLHYGYFENPDVEPDTISFRQLEEAQIKYAENIMAQIKDAQGRILDAGCGMGGLAQMLHQKGWTVDCLTPNKNQIEFINHTFPYLKTFKSKFEEFITDQQYATLIHSESLQYIPLEQALQKAEKLVQPEGRWIVVDYFRIQTDGINRSGHRLEDFLSAVKKHGWEIKYEQDITRNVLPTIAFATMFLQRFLIPVKHFGFEKLRYKKPALYYMTNHFRDKIDQKIAKESASIDPEKFLREKKYILFVLERK